MGIRIKILSGFLILVIMLALAGGWSIYEIRSMGGSVNRILEENYKSIHAAGTMTEALEREDSAMLLLLSGNETDARRIMTAADATFQEGFSIAENNITLPGEDKLVSKIEEDYRIYRSLWPKAAEAQSSISPTWYFEKVHPAFLHLKSNIAELRSLNDEAMYTAASQLEAHAHRAVMPGIVAILSALVFTLIFNYFVHYYMVGPIIRITDGVQKSMETRAPFDVNIETNDELQRLVSALRNLVNRYQQKSDS